MNQHAKHSFPFPFSLMAILFLATSISQAQTAWYPMNSYSSSYSPGTVSFKYSSSAAAASAAAGYASDQDRLSAAIREATANRNRLEQELHNLSGKTVDSSAFDKALEKLKAEKPDPRDYDQQIADAERDRDAEFSNLRAQVSEAERNGVNEEGKLVDELNALKAEKVATAEEAQLADLERQLAQIEKDFENALADLRKGDFCSKCTNSASEIEKRGESFAHHLGRVQGVRIPAPQSVIEQKCNEYAGKINPLKSDIANTKARIRQLNKEHDDKLFKLSNVTIPNTRKQWQDRVNNLRYQTIPAAQQRWANRLALLKERRKNYLDQFLKGHEMEADRIKQAREQAEKDYYAKIQQARDQYTKACDDVRRLESEMNRARMNKRQAESEAGMLRTREENQRQRELEKKEGELRRAEQERKAQEQAAKEAKEAADRLRQLNEAKAQAAAQAKEDELRRVEQAAKEAKESMDRLREFNERKAQATEDELRHQEQERKALEQAAKEAREAMDYIRQSNNARIQASAAQAADSVTDPAATRPIATTPAATETKPVSAEEMRKLEQDFIRLAMEWRDKQDAERKKAQAEADQQAAAVVAATQQKKSEMEQQEQELRKVIESLKSESKPVTPVGNRMESSGLRNAESAPDASVVGDMMAALSEKFKSQSPLPSHSSEGSASSTAEESTETLAAKLDALLPSKETMAKAARDLGHGLNHLAAQAVNAIAEKPVDEVKETFKEALINGADRLLGGAATQLKEKMENLYKPGISDPLYNTLIAAQTANQDDDADVADAQYRKLQITVWTVSDLRNFSRRMGDRIEEMYETYTSRLIAELRGNKNRDLY